MSEKKKRERGANYTPEDKELLLDIISKFKHIIENKRTGGIYIQKKKDAWSAITIKYNSNCSTGPRTTDQLKALYDNMKQKTKKDVGELNKHNYIINKNPNLITKDDLQKALKNIKDDKKEMTKTGGGYWRPITSDSDTKILSIIQDQVEPLKNPYDSAAVFFEDKENTPIEINVEENFFELSDNDVDYGLPGFPSSQQQVIEVIDHPPTSNMTEENILTTKCSKPSKSNATEVCSETSPTPNSNNIIKKPTKPKAKASIQNIIKKSTSENALKKLYFKKKCQNADMERKKIALEIININKKHTLEMMILKKTLSKLSDDK